MDYSLSLMVWHKLWVVDLGVWLGRLVVQPVILLALQHTHTTCRLHQAPVGVAEG